MLTEIFAYGFSGEAAVVGLATSLLLWSAISSLLIYQRRPENIDLKGSSLIWGKWLTSIEFIVSGSRTIMNSYRENYHKPFAIVALKEYIVLVTHPKHIVEVARCPESILSFHAAMKDRLRHKITMMGFEHNAIDPDEYVTMQVVKMHLRKNLAVLNPVIDKAVADGRQVADAFRDGSEILTFQGSAIVTIFTLAKAITGRVNNQVFFGDELSQNAEFARAAIRYPWDGSAVAEICRYLPEFMASTIGNALMAYTGSMRVVYNHLRQLVDKRSVEHENGTGDKHIDVTQFVIATSRTPQQRDPLRMTQLIAALLFAVSLAVPMAMYWAILNLCLHTEFVELLREEIRMVEQENSSDCLKKLRLLDCFLRESARLSPPDALTMQRKAVKSFSFSDGTHVPAGNLVAIPQQAIMRDEAHYPQPDRFNPYRFYTSDPNAEAATQRLTDVNMQFPYWGAPTKSCPGRWYASDVLKQGLVHLLKNYDFEVIGNANPGPFMLATALAPRPGLQIRLKSRIS